ncbi:hypothetical protein [Rhodopila globiformis]|uniref:Uncharacterized protein n=1 Tax=Rhodopila globiformis TaxID=1071 RepID=A0A2S6N5R9_RHOGL|nr:hypothetical protein [Rhodopila globiformis]PPQ29949.1 hypothetical protein CCS01_20340 [Rhodopila globiformis]
MSQPVTPPRSNRLVELVLILLTPMFLCVCDNDIILARQAAADTLNAFGARSFLGVVIAAKIIAYELAALDSLSRSMADDMSPFLVLRFRSNATTLDRAADRNRQLLEQHRIPAAAAHLTPENAAAAVAAAQQRVQQAVASLRATAGSTPQATPQATPQSTAQPATPPASPVDMSDAERRTVWADAMATVAAEFRADLDKLPEAERVKEMMRIDVLTDAASALVSGIAPPIGKAA